MKMLAIFVLVLFSLSAHASKWNEYTKVSETDEYVSFKNGYDTKYVFIKERMLVSTTGAEFTLRIIVMPFL